MTKKFVTITFSDKLNVTKSCSSRNSLSDEMKGLGDESHSSPKTIFLVVIIIHFNGKPNLDDINSIIIVEIGRTSTSKTTV